MESVRGFLAALIGALVISVCPAAADEPSVEFVFPKNLSTVVGRTIIVLRVHVPDGSAVQKAVVSADGKVVATLARPPWSIPWDAGDATAARFLEARLVLTDGREARAAIRTSPLRIDLYEQVSLVNVYAIVRDKSGNYVSDLTRDRFRLFESGRPQKLERFSDEWKPLRIAIVLDTSLSMEGEKLEAAQDAALSFLEALRPQDEGMVVTFSDAVRVAQELTADRAALGAAIRNANAIGGTALYDAVWRTADLLERIDGRRVIVLLSDGRDEAASGLEPGSLHTEAEALDRALRSEAMIFAIGFGRNLERELDFYGKRSLETILRDMAGVTGGRALFSARSAKLRRAFDGVAEDLRHQYSLAYSSDDPRYDGTWREIRLTVADRPDLEVITRKGYFAPKGTEAPKGKRSTRPSR